MDTLLFAEGQRFATDTDAARLCSSPRCCPDRRRTHRRDDLAMHLDLRAQVICRSRVVAGDDNPSRTHRCSEVADPPGDHPAGTAGAICVRTALRPVPRGDVPGPCLGRAITGCDRYWLVLQAYPGAAWPWCALMLRDRLRLRRRVSPRAVEVRTSHTTVSHPLASACCAAAR